MANDREETAQRPNEGTTSAVARLLEAEKQADEIIGRAREQAEEITAQAKRRVQRLKDAGGLAGAPDLVASRSRAQPERQKALIVEECEKRIEAMRAGAAARLDEAVGKLVSRLVGEP